VTKAKSAPTIKVVGSGDSIDIEIDDDVLDRLSEMYPDDDEELVRWALDVGIGELVGRYEMLEDVSQSNDGTHRVLAGDARDDEEGSA
jgi:hypothetical protein